jgi:F-type H+-transporting ATPase subunit b
MADLGFHIPSLLVYLVNFIILLIVLYAVGYKPILKMLDQRAESIRESLESVERVREEAAAQQADIESKLNEGRQEGQALLAQTRDMAEKYRQEEMQKARQDAEALVERAKAAIERERDDAIDQVRLHFSELAVLAAEKIIDKALDENAHKDIINKVLEESPEIK